MIIPQIAQDPVIDWFTSVPDDRVKDLGPPYILCNETHKDEVIQTIAARRIPTSTSPASPNFFVKPRVHIGFSSQPESPINQGNF